MNFVRTITGPPLATRVPPLRATARSVALVLALVAAPLIQGARTAHATYPCEPPNSACTANFYGNNMVAWFRIDGFPTTASWNFQSISWFFAYPRSGDSTQIYAMTHRVNTTSGWPTRTWLRYQLTWYSGLIDGWPSSPYVTMGPNQWGGTLSDFYHERPIFYIGPIWFDDIPEAYIEASFYPSGGAGEHGTMSATSAST